jgi:hypothetical protein
LQVLKLFTSASGFLQTLCVACAVPARRFMAVGCHCRRFCVGFRVESHLRTKGTLFVPRNPASLAGSVFQTAHAVSPMPLMPCQERAVSDLRFDFLACRQSSA